MIEIVMEAIYSKGLVQGFKKTFLNAYRAPFGIQSLGCSWRTENNHNSYLTDDKVRAHLNGKYYIGGGTRAYTKYIVVDIDAHNEESQSEIWKRADLVKDAFGDVCPEIYTTPSGGMHMYYMLDRSVWNASANEYAKDVLTNSGMNVRKGYIEILPAGNTLVRAPMGGGCFALDPKTMMPYNTNHEKCVRVTYDRVMWHQHQCIEIPDKYNPTASRQAKPTKHQVPNGQPSEYMQKVNDLWQYGLVTPNSRNEALLELSWYWRCLRVYDVESTIDQLWKWIQTKHNGLSNDYNTNPDEVYRHIKALVPSTTVEAWQDKAKDVTSVTEHLNMQMQADRLNYAREKVSLLGLRVADAELLANIICYAEHRGTSYNGGWLKVQIPALTLRRWDRAYTTKLDRLRAKGLVLDGRNYCRIKSRSREYRVRPVLGST
jgi:hypothetical protein